MESTFSKMLDYTSAQTNKQPRSERTRAVSVYFSCYSQKERD